MQIVLWFRRLFAVLSPQIHDFALRPICMESVMKSYSLNALVCTCQQHFSDVSHSYLALYLLTCKIWWAPNNASRWQMGFNSAFKGLIYLSQILRNLRSRKLLQIKQWPQTIFLFTNWDNSNSHLRASILGSLFQIWNPKLQVVVTLVLFFRRDADHSSLSRKFIRLLLTGRVTMSLL